MKKIAVLMLLLASVGAFCQEADINILPEHVVNASLAMSNPDYMVTAGDVYQLAYAAGSTAVTYPIIIDTTYKMRVANLSVIDVYGKTFPEVKALVEQIITRNYPMSGLQFTLEKPASFMVKVDGEVSSAGEKKAWALTRLSDVVGSFYTAYSSTRTVTVTSSSGKKKVYDLFEAKRNGNLAQNPYVRPGDHITIQRAERKVTIDGAVERPGTYELLEGENLKELIEKYASGLTLFADVSRIELTRFKDSENEVGDKLFYNEDAIASNIPLNAHDSIVILNLQDLTPVMFMEGAVLADNNTVVSPESSNRITIRFTMGENYGSLVRRYRSVFSAVSDTQKAYIIRGTRTIPLNINPLLYDADYYTNELVEQYDVLLIPFRQFFITVSGAVYAPGRYPYIPDRDWEYYVGLAGGINKERNSFDSVKITSIRGEKMNKEDAITPETIIDVRSNSFLYFFGKYAPVVTTVLSLVTTVFMYLRL